MAHRHAFATLITSDHYLPGALALVAALRDVHPTPPVEPEVPYETVCIVTPETVDVNTIKHLRRTFDVVIGVEVIEQLNDAGLRLLGEFVILLSACLLPVVVPPSAKRSLSYTSRYSESSRSSKFW